MDGLVVIRVFLNSYFLTSVIQKRISVRKIETTTEDQVKRKEEKKIEETLRQMNSPEEVCILAS